MDGLSKRELLRRSLFLISGLFFMALGICLVTESGLGTSAVSAPAYVSSLIFPFSFAQFTFLANMIMLAGQILLMGKAFEKRQYLQIPVTFVFSYFIGLMTRAADFLNAGNYLSQLLMLFAGCVFLGLGVAIEVLAEVVLLPGEGLVRAAVFRFGKAFGVLKTALDISMVLLSVLLSSCFLGRIEGIREGTLITALTVGGISHFFMKRLAFVRRRFPAGARGRQSA